MNDCFIEPEWPFSSDIHAVTTLRCGGVSRGAFQSMNPASHVGDNPLSVLRNRKILIKRLNLPAEPIWLKQEHGNRVIDGGLRGPRNADASFTVEKRVVLAILTADCLPVLLCDPISGMIAAVHAGWRGMVAGVIEAALKKVGDQTVAWLGPAIGPNAFMVGSDVREAFLAKSHEFSAAFRMRDDAKWFMDLYAAAKTILTQNGIRFITGGQWCTHSDPERFFSYRREAVCGRMATLIWRE